MKAFELIVQEFQAGQSTETAGDALHKMEDQEIFHLPIIQGNQFLGYVSEQHCSELKKNKSISDIIEQGQIYSYNTDHFFDVWAKMAEFKMSCLAVLDRSNNQYVGTISQQKLVEFYFTIFPFSEPGSIIILEMRKQDYSLAQVCRIVEGERQVVLSSFVSPLPDDTKMLLTIKINTEENQRILMAMERFGYTIHSSFIEEDFSNVYQERIDSFMRYLNV